MFFNSVFLSLLYGNTKITLRKEKLSNITPLLLVVMILVLVSLIFFFYVVSYIDESDELGKEYHIRVRDIELITGRKMELSAVKRGYRRYDVPCIRNTRI